MSGGGGGGGGGRTADSRSCCFGTGTSRRSCTVVTRGDSSSLDSSGSTTCTSSSNGSSSLCCCCCCLILTPGGMCRCCCLTPDVVRRLVSPAARGCCWCPDAATQCCRPPTPLCCPLLAAGQCRPGIQSCSVEEARRSKESSGVCRGSRGRQSTTSTCYCCCGSDLFGQSVTSPECPVFPAQSCPVSSAMTSQTDSPAVRAASQSRPVSGGMTSVKCPWSSAVTSPECPFLSGQSRPVSGAMTSQTDSPAVQAAGQSRLESGAMTSPSDSPVIPGPFRPLSVGVTSPPNCPVRGVDVDVGRDVDLSFDSNCELNLQLRITGAAAPAASSQGPIPCIRVSTPLQTISIRLNDPLSSTSPVVCDYCPAQPDTRDLPTCGAGRASSRRSANADEAKSSRTSSAATTSRPPGSTSAGKSLGTSPQARVRSSGEQSKSKNPATEKRRVTPRMGTRSSVTSDTERSAPTVDKMTPVTGASEVGSAKPVTLATTITTTTAADGAGKQDKPARGRLERSAAAARLPSTDGTTPCRDLPAHIFGNLTHVFAQLASRLTAASTESTRQTSTEESTHQTSPIPRGEDLRRLVDAVAGIEADVCTMAAALKTTEQRHLADTDDTSAAAVTHSPSFTVLPDQHDQLSAGSGYDNSQFLGGFRENVGLYLLPSVAK